ncbi:MAG: glutamate synthase large subunit [Verrucomicrobiota bacterium]|jgi:glutamate synthase (NADPH/NADH) large chain
MNSAAHSQRFGLPQAQGLYDPRFEHDACGVGFVAHIKGNRSHQIVLDAITVLTNLEHRGGCGCETNTGDGAGILVSIPHEFLAGIAPDELGRDLPRPGQYGTGIVFLPTDPSERDLCKSAIARIVAEQGQTLLGWRKVPTDNSLVGPTARRTEPVMEQIFVGAQPDLPNAAAFDRQLYIIRKRASRELRYSGRLQQAALFYFCSLSTGIMVYKGQLTAPQLLPYFPDLAQPDFISHLAMVHSRFSTNTFPSWDRAQPLRCMAHNGEINTLRGNVNWMHARQGIMSSPLFGERLKDTFPVIEPDTSDSGNFDNALEHLLMTGRSLQEAIMMMIPEAWQNAPHMSDQKKAFYEFQSCLMEPWDGPASVAFTDGRLIGAVLDRNGLRPSRYYVTHDDRVIMSSEVGVLDIAPENVQYKGRLQPGKMFLVDFEQGRIISDEELKTQICSRHPYRSWLENQRLDLPDLPVPEQVPDLEESTIVSRLRAFGYTLEHIDMLLTPMALNGQEPLGSMGNDAPLACLSDQPRMLYDYFKQLFAQVTNPAIDSIREEIVMSLECYIGTEGNLLDATEEHAHRLRIPNPILTNAELAALKSLDHRGWRSRIIDITYPLSGGIHGLTEAMDRICAEAREAVRLGFSLLILSDRNLGPDRIPISSLLAVGSVHHHLLLHTERTRIGIILETGEAREVHHHCLLTGYGADAINPYLTFEALWHLRRQGLTSNGLDDEQIVENYRKAIAKGMRKVMGKMGISTLQSYKGAQIFEAVGLDREVVDRAFTGTASRIQGVGFSVLAEEAWRRHQLGYPARSAENLEILPNPGDFQWRAKGEKHAWDPESIYYLQLASRTNDRAAYDEFARLINEDSARRASIRGLLQFKQSQPVPLDEVEPASEIVKRFCTGAMSFGSISSEAHESLAIAMNRLGGKSNTGEGGEKYERFAPMPNGDSKRSAIKQIASGRFGVNIYYLTNADQLQIKISQGAKPGEGGELPGHKVNEEIAATRHTTPGVTLISPPPHHDIYSIEDLAQLIFDLKNANPVARISVKLVSEVGVGTIAAGVAKGHADHILISGHDGGTGASPLTGIKHAGLPWELGLAETHQTLVLNDLRSRVRLETDGQLKTGRDVVIAAMLGAEEFGFATAPLITLGCLMMRKCHLNTCPVGIATQRGDLRAKFRGSPDHVVNYLMMVAEETREHMAALGFRTMDEMIGRVELLETNTAIEHWKGRGLDFSTILTPARKPHPDVEVRCTIPQDHGIEKVLDNRLILRCADALEAKKPVHFSMPIQNTDRTVGGLLSHEITKRWGLHGLPDDTIHIAFRGSAGQSFGAWLAPGVTFELEGDANDYVGKGLSGGKLIVYPPKNATFRPCESILIGNVILYGAIKGEAYFRGIAGERFCVRNSGVSAVVEGVGDHGCEYMTGGFVAVLGRTGTNFAAGMSGGVAYVWDVDGLFAERCNPGMVELEPVDQEGDANRLRTMVEQHLAFTGSNVARDLLKRWPDVLPQFVRVMPSDYKRILEEEEQRHAIAEAGRTNGLS